MPRGRPDPRQFDLLGPVATPVEGPAPTPRPAAVDLDDERLVDALNAHLFGAAGPVPPMSDLVAAAAARCLSSAVGPLLQALRRSRGHDLAQPGPLPGAIATALGAIGDRSAAPGLVAVVTEARHGTATLAAAMEALAALGDRSARSAARAALDHSEPSVRRAACRLAGATGASEAVPRLVAIAAEDLPAVATEATLALGHLGHRAAKPALEASLDRAAPVDLPRVLAALRGLVDAESAVHIGRASERMNETGRCEAVAILGEIGGPAAVGWLSRRAQDGRPTVRAAVALALEGLDEPTATTALGRLADDPDPTVRAAARRGLARRDPTW